MQNNPIIEFIITLPHSIENYILFLMGLYFDSIFMYPFSLMNILFLLELMLGWKLFPFDKFSTKPHKMENNWWLEYKQSLFYFMFVMELFIYSNCFWQPYNISLIFILIFFLLLNWLFGFMSESMKDRWNISLSFLLFYTTKFNWFFFFLMQLMLFVYAYLIILSLKITSCLFFSFLFLFFSVVDYFMYMWLKKSWPIFKETDEGEFFELFDSFYMQERSLCFELQKEKSLIFKNMLYYSKNSLICTPYSNPVIDTSDMPLFDYWGVEYGVIRWSEKHFDEYSQSYDLYTKRTTTNFWIEPLSTLDPYWKKLNKNSQSSSYCLTLSFMDFGFLLKSLGYKSYFDSKSLWNMKKMAPSYNELVEDPFWMPTFYFSQEDYDVDLDYYYYFTCPYDFDKMSWLMYGYWLNSYFLFILISVPYAKTLFDKYPLSNFELMSKSHKFYDFIPDWLMIDDLTSQNMNSKDDSESDSSESDDEAHVINKNKPVDNEPMKTIFPLKYYMENRLQAALYEEPVSKDLTPKEKESDELNVVFSYENDNLVFKNLSSSSLSYLSFNSVVSTFFEEHNNRVDVLDLMGFLGVVLSYDLNILRFSNLFFYLSSVWFMGKWDSLFFSSSIYFFNQRDFFMIFFYTSESSLNKGKYISKY